MTLRNRWSDGGSTLGAWLALSDPVAAEAAAGVGYDYVCVDQQHGTADYASLLAMVQAIGLGGGVPITRVQWNDPGLIGRALDAGAHGVIVPMVNSAAEAEAVVRAARYAPAGGRSYGPVLPGLRVGDPIGWADANVTVIPMIETTEAITHLDDILSVPGIDAIYVGPADLSLTLGLPPGNNDGEPTFDAALAAIVAGCERHGVVAGIHATPALVARRLELGFRMVTVTSDLIAMRSGMVDHLATARSGTADDDGDAMY